MNNDEPNSDAPSSSERTPDEPTAKERTADEHTADERRAALYRVFAKMQHLVLQADDRRREVTEATGMSFARTRALRRLARNPMRISELAAELGTDKPYASLIVDDLEQRGLVLRTISDSDRRVKVVTLTEPGRQLAVLADQILAQPPEALTQLSDDEVAALDALLTKIAG